MDKKIEILESDFDLIIYSLTLLFNESFNVYNDISFALKVSFIIDKVVFIKENYFFNEISGTKI